MDETIPITRPSTAQKLPDAVRQALSTNGESTKRLAPTFEVDLPSNGHFYPESSPLSSGKIKLYEVSAKHEDILSNTALLKKGTVLDEFLKAVIATPDVSINDLLIGDKNAVFLAARRSAYGDDYKTKIKCPECGMESTPTVDLSEVKSKPFNFDGMMRGMNQFTYVLPSSGKTITWKLLTHKDESAIELELKTLAKIANGISSPEVTTRLKYSILEVDGKSDRGYVKSFVDNDLSARDSLAFRREVKEHTPDTDMTFNFTCQHCGHEERLPLPLGANFFWPGTTD